MRWMPILAVLAAVAFLPLALGGQPTDLRRGPAAGDELCVEAAVPLIPLGKRRVVAVRGGDLWLDTCRGNPFVLTGVEATDKQRPEAGGRVGVFSTWAAYQLHEADFQALQAQRDGLAARVRQLETVLAACRSPPP